jgi:hypothetical protein
MLVRAQALAGKKRGQPDSTPSASEEDASPEKKKQRRLADDLRLLDLPPEIVALILHDPIFSIRELMDLVSTVSHDFDTIVQSALHHLFSHLIINRLRRMREDRTVLRGPFPGDQLLLDLDFLVREEQLSPIPLRERAKLTQFYWAVWQLADLERAIQEYEAIQDLHPGNGKMQWQEYADRIAQSVLGREDRATFFARFGEDIDVVIAYVAEMDIMTPPQQQMDDEPTLREQSSFQSKHPIPSALYYAFNAAADTLDTPSLRRFIHELLWFAPYAEIRLLMQPWGHSPLLGTPELVASFATAGRAQPGDDQAVKDITRNVSFPRDGIEDDGPFLESDGTLFRVNIDEATYAKARRDFDL